MKTIFLILSLFATASTFAQDLTSANVCWNASTTLEVLTGNIEHDAGKVIVYRKDCIEWRDSAGSVKFSFAIEKTEGNLTAGAPGEITYRIASAKESGTMIITKDETQSKIRFFLVKDAEPLAFELAISNNQILD